MDVIDHSSQNTNLSLLDSSLDSWDKKWKLDINWKKTLRIEATVIPTEHTGEWIRFKSLSVIHWRWQKLRKGCCWSGFERAILCSIKKTKPGMTPLIPSHQTWHNVSLSWLISSLSLDLTPWIQTRILWVDSFMAYPISLSRRVSVWNHNCTSTARHLLHVGSRSKEVGNPVGRGSYIESQIVSICQRTRRPNKGSTIERPDSQAVRPMHRLYGYAART
jgi:hypothetical protein